MGNDLLGGFIESAKLGMMGTDSQVTSPTAIPKRARPFAYSRGILKIGNYPC